MRFWGFVVGFFGGFFGGWVWVLFWFFVILFWFGFFVCWFGFCFLFSPRNLCYPLDQDAQFNLALDTARAWGSICNLFQYLTITVKDSSVYPLPLSM